MSDKRILNGSFLIGDRSENGTFGWMVSASGNDNDFGLDNVETEWSDEFEFNTAPLNKTLTNGLLVAMSDEKNFYFYDLGKLGLQ
ncbi:MAG: hypothetical protein WA810_00670 [Maribacter sp.]